MSDNDVLEVQGDVQAAQETWVISAENPLWHRVRVYHLYMYKMSNGGYEAGVTIRTICGEELVCGEEFGEFDGQLQFAPDDSKRHCPKCSPRWFVA